MSYLSEFKKADLQAKEKEAYEYLVNTLIRDNKRGNDKIIGLSGVNMEDKSPTSFVPAMIYTFLYNSQNKDTVGNGKFYDRVPLIFCTGFDRKTITGINLNYMPNDVRAGFLDIIVGNYEDFYEDLDGRNFKVNEKLGSILTNPQAFVSVLPLIKGLLKFDVSKCLRTYNRKDILFSRLVETDAWGLVPYLVFKDAVRGVDLAKAQIKNLER